MQFSVFLAYWTIEKSNRAGVLSSTQVAAIAFMIAVLYGLAMELFQLYYWEGRHFEIADMIANTVGALLGVYIFKRVKK